MEHLPTGSRIIDYLIGGKPNSRGVAPCPGLPKGKIVNVYGHEGSGKSTLCLTAAAKTIQNGGVVAYIDWEHEIVPHYAEALGVPIGDDSKFILAQPETLEDGLVILWAMASAGVDLILLDSVGAAVPRAYFDKSLADTGDGGRLGAVAGAWSLFLPKLKSRIGKTGSTIIGVSQIRDSVNTMGYGDNITVQGGKAWKFYSAIRMRFQRISSEKVSTYNALLNKSEDRVVGATIKAKLDKCKVSSQQGNEEIFYIRWGEGIDDIRSLIEIATSHNVIHKAGSWVTWRLPDGEEVKVQGIEKLRKEIIDRKLSKTLEHQVSPFLAGKVTEVQEDESFDDDEGGIGSELDDIISKMEGFVETQAESPL